jgi:hypothetical protein
VLLLPPSLLLLLLLLFHALRSHPIPQHPAKWRL